MKAESQPTMSIPRMHRMTVAEVIEALKNAPPDAEIQCKGGGYLEAGEWSAWGEVILTSRPLIKGSRAIVKTVWE